MLRTIPNASYLIFHTPYYDYVDCRILGVQTADNLIKPQDCQMSDDDYRKMEFYTTLEATRLLHVEQKYRFKYAQGRCVVYAGAHLYNEQLLEKGHAVLSEKGFDKDSEALLKRLKKAYAKAQKNKSGFWNDFPEGMQCLKRAESGKN